MRIDSPEIVGALSLPEGASASGSFSGSFQGDGTNLTGITAEWDGTHTGNATITGDLTVDNLITAGNVDGRDVSVDGTKLDTIEENADVTDTDNVTAAGALMDSEVDADIKTLSLPANTTISSFGATLVDDADAATARTTIGLGNVDNTSDTDKPVSTATQTALDLKANLASPALTGNPTAPTQTGTDDSTKIATTAFVQDRIDTIIGNAGSTLDTLGELSASLSDEEDALSALTTTVGTKLAKSSNLSDLQDAATARTNLGLGSIATLSSIDISDNTNLAAGTGITLTGDTLSITDNSVGATQLNVAGNGSNGQYLGSDGDGTMTWTNIPAGYTVANSSDNRILTAVDSTNGNAESNLTFDGSTLDITGNVNASSTGQFSSIGVNTAPSGVAGAILATNDVVAFASSDERLKENLEPIGSAVEKVEQLTGYTYNWIPMEGVHVYGDMKDVGVIAQEVEKVLPELVSDRENGYKAVKYDKLTAVLIQAVKELSERVKTLEGYHN